MEHTASDLLSHPPRPKQPVKSNRPRTSFTNRKFVTRDQGLRYFRLRWFVNPKLRHRSHPRRCAV